MQKDDFSEREWELADYIELFRRYQLLIITVFTLVLAGTAIRHFSRPPLYASLAILATDESGAASVDRFARMYNFPGQLREEKSADYYQSILTSPLSFERLLGRAQQDSLLNESTAAHVDEIQAVISRLRFAMNPESGLMTLSVEAESPLLAWRIADLATAVFCERYHEIGAEAAREKVRVIDRQRQEAQERLEQAERRLYSWEGGGSLFLTGSDGSLMDKVARAEALLEQATARRELAESNFASMAARLQGPTEQSSGPDRADPPEAVPLRARLAELDERQHTLAMAPLPDSAGLAALGHQITAARAELRQLLVSRIMAAPPKAGDISPAVRDGLVQRMASEQIELESLRNLERYYRDAIRDYRRQSPDLVDKSIDYIQLRRTHTVHQNLLNFLVERHEEARIDAAIGFGGLRVVSPAAMAAAPLPRGTLRALGFGALFGLLLGLGAAAVLAWLDQTVRSKEELERITGLPVIGQVPFSTQGCGSRSAGKWLWLALSGGVCSCLRVAVGCGRDESASGGNHSPRAEATDSMGWHASGSGEGRESWLPGGSDSGNGTTGGNGGTHGDDDHADLSHWPGRSVSERGYGMGRSGNGRKVHTPRNDKSGSSKEPCYPLLDRVEPHTPYAEAFHTLRTDLQFYGLDRPLNKLLITSSIPGEGKTLVTANLAAAYARLGHRVVIVDADLRRPSQSTAFRVRRQPGLTDYFTGQASLAEIVRPLRISGLELVPAGTLPPNPAEVLGSGRMAELIARLEESHDILLVDAPPLLAMADAREIARLIGSILLVFRSGHTQRHCASEAVASLRQVQATVIGFVFNGVDLAAERGYYRYYYAAGKTAAWSAARAPTLDEALPQPRL